MTDFVIKELNEKGKIVLTEEEYNTNKDKIQDLKKEYKLDSCMHCKDEIKRERIIVAIMPSGCVLSPSQGNEFVNVHSYFSSYRICEKCEKTFLEKGLPEGFK